MIDTITHVIDTVRITSDYGIDLINKVDSFYESSWNKLILSASAAFAIIGIIVPLIIQFYQNKSLKANEAELKRDFLNMSSDLKNQLEEFISNKFKTEREQINEKHIELNATVKAHVFHLQANDQILKKEYFGATKDFLFAAQGYIKCKDFANLQITLEALSNNCLPHLQKNQFDQLIAMKAIDVDKFINDLRSANTNGILSNYINALRVTLLKFK